MATTLVFLSLALQPSPAGFPAQVVNVSDGDTLTVLRDDKTRVKIRVHGIDAPELGQDFGRRASEAVSVLVDCGAVTILPRDTDRFGRTVAEVRLHDGRSLGVEMVRSGMAWHFVRYAPADDELAQAEAAARKAGVGLWSKPDPVAPWDWRKGRGEELTAKVVGNRRSMLYHSPNCRGVSAMKEANRVEFDTAEKAEAAWYRRAGDCVWRKAG